MKIDFNETEIQAMEAFFRGDGEGGHVLQDQFLEEIKEECLKQKNTPEGTFLRG